jgi:hypothetical protein
VTLVVLRDAYRRLRRVQHDAAAPRDDNPLVQTAAAGAAWLLDLAARHGIPFEELMEVEERVRSRTVTGVKQMIVPGGLSVDDALAAAHGGGFSNGLALGLEFNHEEAPQDPTPVEADSTLPHKGHRIDGLWALIAIDENGNEGLMGGGLGKVSGALVVSTYLAREGLLRSARRAPLDPGWRIVLRHFTASGHDDEVIR